jgi:hypothetical protein
MTHIDFDDLAHRVLENRATPMQRAELEARLDADPAARERFDTLAAAFRGLGSLERVAPPPDLADGILGALRAEPPHRGAPAAVAGRSPSTSGRALGLRLAAAFAAGIAVTALTFSIGGGFRSLDGRPVEGAMVPPARVQAARLEAGEASAAIEARFGAGEVLMRIEARPDRDAALAIAHPGRTVAEIRPLDASAGTVSIERDRVVFHVDAPATWTLRFSDVEDAGAAPDPSLQVVLESGTESQRRTLNAPGAAGR